MKFSFFWVVLFIIANIDAAPKNLEIVSGSASLEKKANHLEIKPSNKAILNWEDFSINANEKVIFTFDKSSHCALNRVIGTDPSKILGSLESNGKIYLINPNGIFIGKDAYINVASFIASTFDILNKDFLSSDELLFQKNSDASLFNLGTIHTTLDDIVLISSNIKNEGNIQSAKSAYLLSQDTVFLKTTDNDLIIKMQKDQNEKNLISKIENTGNIYVHAINGIKDDSNLHVAQEKGKIYLFADEIYLKENSTIDASSNTNAGEILIGGDYQGKNDSFINSQRVFVDKDVSILANSNIEGKAGKIILWADDNLTFLGKAHAQNLGVGDGGFIEISAPTFFVNGDVNTSAKNGNNGLKLFDPANITITNANFNITAASPFVATGAGATLNVATLTASLAGDTIVRTRQDGFAGDGDIIVNSAITWTQASTLTLDAYRDIIINQAITNVPPAGPLITVLDSSLSLIAGRDIQISNNLINPGAPFSTGINARATRDLLIGTGSQINDITISTNHADLSLVAGNEIKVLGGNGGYIDIVTKKQGNTFISGHKGIYLKGGDTGGAYVLIENEEGGNIALTAPEGDFSMIGGNNSTDGSVYIDLNNNLAPAAGSGVLSIENINNMNLYSGNHRNSPVGITQRGYDDLIIRNVKGNINLVTHPTDVVNAFQMIIILNYFAGNLIFDNVKGDFNMIAQGGNIQVQAIAGGAIRMDIDGDINIFGGSGTNANACIFAAFDSNIYIKTKKNINLRGGSSSNPITSEGGYVSINAFYSSHEPPSPDPNVNFKQFIIEAENINLLGGTNSLGNNIAFISVGNNIDDYNDTSYIYARNSLYLEGKGSSSNTKAVIEIIPSYCYLDPAIYNPPNFYTRAATKSMSIFAGNNIYLKNNSFINGYSSGYLNIVTDYNTAYPNFGGGHIEIADTARINCLGKLRIFSGVREMNIFPSSINNTTYVPVSQTYDSNHERWGSNYPNSYYFLDGTQSLIYDFGGGLNPSISGDRGFALFYKNLYLFPNYYLYQKTFYSSEMLKHLTNKVYFFEDIPFIEQLESSH